MGKILLYYKYISIKNPDALKKEQMELCRLLQLKGRVLIAQEGINGTLGGTEENIERYIIHMKNNPLFKDIDFKTSEGNEDDFPRLYITIKKEVVRLGINPHDLTPEQGGVHLSPQKVHEFFDSFNKEEMVVLDCRNEYESRIGSFKYAIKPAMETFRDLPSYIDEHIDMFKDKKVFTYCTGGVRCERASAYLKVKGVEEVYQASGGIHRYVEEYPEGYFRGKNYVFDGRGAIKVNDDILTTCQGCSIPYDTYSNCMNSTCNQHITICEKCLEHRSQTCSPECDNLVREGKVPVRKVEKKSSSNSCSL